MKLSEALRLGATLAPQIKHFRHDDKGGACALGHAELAVAQSDYAFGAYRRAEMFWPLLFTYIAHPVGGWEGTVAWVIASLNNDYDWTTNQIADWVETVEPKEQAPALSQNVEPSFEHVEHRVFICE